MYQVSQSELDVFKGITQFKKAVRAIDMYEGCPEHITRPIFDGALKKLLDIGVVEKIERGIYQVLTTDASAFKVTPRKRYTKSKGSTTPAPVATQPEINLSTTANKFADYASELLKENNDLRALLLQVHSTIGNALSINSEE